MLAEELRRALETVTVAPDARSAVVGDQEIEATEVAELRPQLAAEIYQSWHVGKRLDQDTPLRTLRESDFEAELANAVPSPWRTQYAPVFFAKDAAGEVVVELSGVRVRVPADRLRMGAEPSPGDYVPLELETARPAVSPGFFFVDRSQGVMGGGTGPTLRIYVHVAHANAAVGLWSAVLTELEKTGMPYRTKVSSARRLFPRRDGIVVYLGPGAWQASDAVTKAVASTGGEGRGHDTSIFAERLGPGISRAWEPYDDRPGMRGRSFGEHRAAVVAGSLIEYASDPAVRLRDRETAVAAALRSAGVDPLVPARNLGSPH